MTTQTGAGVANLERISEPIVDQVALRLAGHATAHGLPKVRSRVRAAGSALLAAGALTSDGECFLAGILAAATE